MSTSSTTSGRAIDITASGFSTTFHHSTMSINMVLLSDVPTILTKLSSSLLHRSINTF
ncbi:hypothetical protein C8Q74DRAFT_1243679 [Fomes fomentarius]|nr:hypothetical protein C8Q74DRAFT_1243679 [Fomes fomentarius]